MKGPLLSYIKVSNHHKIAFVAISSRYLYILTELYWNMYDFHQKSGSISIVFKVLRGESKETIFLK